MLIVGNWKAYVETVEKAKKLYETSKKLAIKGSHDIVLAPPAPFLGLLAPANKSKVAFAAQDVSATLGGATTGEITAPVISGLKATYTIVGHSERRAQGDTDEIVVEKVRHALAHGLIPILCIGETSRDADAVYLQFLRKEISAVFSVLSPKERLQVVVAYEPIWAIGHTAGEAIAHSDLTETVLYIRKVLGDFIPGRGSLKVRVLYGGSVEPANARELAGSTGIDGFLVGHASTDPVSFSALVKAVS